MARKAVPTIQQQDTMYRYTDFDRQFVQLRAEQFRDQLERRQRGELSDEQFLPLRLQNGWYVQRYAPMLRIAVPYGEISSAQLRVLARLAREFDQPEPALLREAQRTQDALQASQPGLTLVAPAGLGPDIAGDFIAGFIKESRARKLRPYLEMLVADPDLVTADMVEDVLKFKRLDGALAALQAIAAANFDGNAQRVSLRDRLGEIGVPVHVVWGEADRVLPASHAEGLPDNVTVTVIPGAGHIVHMEKAGEVNKVITGAS